MRIIESIIDDIKPPKKSPSNVWIGLHWTVVKAKYAGMAHTYKTKDAQSIKNGGKLSTLYLDELCSMALSDNTLEASVGCAAINSLIKPTGKIGNIENKFKSLGKGKVVSIIGRFPFNDEIRKLSKKCYVLEINPSIDELPSTSADDILPKCDLNIITATTLINHTIDHLLELGSGGTNIILGPTTPFSDILFDHGAHILAGVKVTNVVELQHSVTQGVKKFRDIGGIQPLYMTKP